MSKALPKKAGTIIGKKVLTHPMLLNIKYVGTNVTAPGSIMVPSNTMKMASRPGARSREKP